MSFWPLLVVQLVVFAVMVAVLRRIFGQNLMRATAHLQGLNAEYTRRHDELKEKLAQAETQYAEQITRARTEAERLLAQARQDAESSRGRSTEEARAEGERIVQQALETREAIRRELEQGVEKRAIERAREFLESALPESMRRRLQAAWIDELAADGLRQLKARVSDGAPDAIRVVSALPLDDRERGALRERVRDTFGAGCRIEEAVDAGLVAGVSITVGSLVLDGSLGSAIHKVVRDAQPAA